MGGVGEILGGVWEEALFVVVLSGGVGEVWKVFGRPC